MALYHKHRPQTFSDIIGQDHIVKTISNQIAGDNVAHAYLFSGPRGIGKTTIARLLSKAINCTDKKEKDSEPCDKCESCVEVTSSRSIDVIEIDAASHTGVDNVRENIIENARFKPTKSKYKVFIIDEVHMLSTSAFNALLKTLEEPPSHVIFILATTELHKLPETIVSRCQRFDFKKVGFDDMGKQINKIGKSEGIKIDKDVVERIVNKSDGCVRDAISLLDQIMASGEKQITAENSSLVLPTVNVEKNLEFITALIEKNTAKDIEIINQLVEDGINISYFNNDVIEMLRIMMVSKTNANISGLGLDLSEKVRKELKKLNDKVEYSDIVVLLDLFMTRGSQIKTSPIPQLPLEMAVIEYCNKEQGLRIKEKDNHDDGNPPLSDKKREEVPKKMESDQETKTVVEKKTITEKVKNLVTKNVDFSLENVKDKWNDFMRKVENEKKSLSFVLKMAEIKDLEGNTLILSTNFSFHSNKLMESENKKDLEKMLTEIMGSKMQLNVTTSEKNKISEESQELKELASSLGGEIV
ncbi:MAG: DNA polymerase III subunit gamma/tau [Candidatus Magasanikbacteria bacterium]|jgi:DNA polymerase III subunit gamma/tau|nr:DNA polymerase III subunit gamma/tau [Candidatus Magasanikbacteria bacterium]MBT4314903.1 DNA polymerase III subunit gamma/tau [Candidatus Magasanikbacteria bacterium]MBT4546859.1 DNA polymerase III subunit gamma/tau [Candidatus Magasanikbacteria bacterium]MBT6819268.1 DNA polymerase III subunit gamma/tau [Candidatus Magasanikbacteria bacterium]